MNFRMSDDTMLLYWLFFRLRNGFSCDFVVFSCVYVCVCVCAFFAFNKNWWEAFALLALYVLCVVAYGSRQRVCIGILQSHRNGNWLEISLESIVRSSLFLRFVVLSRYFCYTLYGDILLLLLLL